MVQFKSLIKTFMASYNHCMIQLIVKFPLNYCIFKIGFYFFWFMGAVLHLLVGGLAIVKTSHLDVGN